MYDAMRFEWEAAKKHSKMTGAGLHRTDPTEPGFSVQCTLTRFFVHGAMEPSIKLPDALLSSQLLHARQEAEDWSDSLRGALFLGIPGLVDRRARAPPGRVLNQNTCFAVLHLPACLGGGVIVGILVPSVVRPTRSSPPTVHSPPRFCPAYRSVWDPLHVAKATW